MSKTIYLHPNIRVYRKEIFEKLAKFCNVDFAFTGKPRFESHISEEISKLQSDFDGNYVQCDEYNLPIRNLSSFVLSLPFQRKYKNVIFSCCLSIPFLLLAIPLKISGKRVFIFDELWRYPQEVRKFGILSSFVRFLVRNVTDGVVVAGTQAKEFYINYFNFPEQKVYVAFNTTINSVVHEENTYNKIKSKIDGLGNNDAPKLLYLGRVVEYKGLDVLLNAIKNINVDFTLYIVGDGDFKKSAEDLVRKLDLCEKVFFLGSCTSDESTYFYQATDGFILPTKFLLNEPVQIESWGFTINEAMAVGKPVLSTTAVGSARDLIIEGHTGYIAKAGCINDISIKLNMFINAIKNKNFKAENIINHLQSTCNYDDNLNAYKRMLSKK